MWPVLYSFNCHWAIHFSNTTKEYPACYDLEVLYIRRKLGFRLYPTGSMAKSTERALEWLLLNSIYLLTPNIVKVLFWCCRGTWKKNRTCLFALHIVDLALFSVLCICFQIYILLKKYIYKVINVKYIRLMMKNESLLLHLSLSFITQSQLHSRSVDIYWAI